MTQKIFGFDPWRETPESDEQRLAEMYRQFEESGPDIMDPGFFTA